MKVEQINLSEERKLITILIMSDTACNKLLPIIDKHSTKTLYAGFICTWVREYFDQYKIAPKNVIQELFEQHRLGIRDEEITQSISSFLESLANDYDEADYDNIDFFITNAEMYIRMNQVEYLQEQLDKAKSSGNVIKCESLIAGFKQKVIPESQGISLIDDPMSFAESFAEENTDPLFSFTGDLHSVLGGFHRGDLSAFISTSKAGKSWCLQGLAFAALANSCRTLVINLEMRDLELRQRYWRGLVNAPVTSGPIKVPFFRPDKETNESIDSENVMWRVDHKIVNMEGVSFTNTNDLMQRMKMRYKGGDIKLMSMPSYSTTWDDINAVLDNLEYYDSWVPSLLIVDYFDLMDADEKDYRQKINRIWATGRKVALDRKIHVATVSQTNAQGNKNSELTLDSISEDQRKKSHVSMLCGMWADDNDRQNGIVRLKRLVGRGKPETFDGAIVLQNLDCGQWCIDSRLSSKVEG